MIRVRIRGTVRVRVTAAGGQLGFLAAVLCRSTVRVRVRAGVRVRVRVLFDQDEPARLA